MLFRSRFQKQEQKPVSSFQNYQDFDPWQQPTQEPHYNLLHHLGSNLSKYEKKYIKEYSLSKQSPNSNRRRMPECSYEKYLSKKRQSTPYKMKELTESDLFQLPLIGNIKHQQTFLEKAKRIFIDKQERDIAKKNRSQSVILNSLQNQQEENKCSDDNDIFKDRSNFNNCSLKLHTLKFSKDKIKKRRFSYQQQGQKRDIKLSRRKVVLKENVESEPTTTNIQKPKQRKSNGQGQLFKDKIHNMEILNVSKILASLSQRKQKEDFGGNNEFNDKKIHQIKQINSKLIK